jgi:hypothetical protein
MKTYSEETAVVMYDALSEIADWFGLGGIYHNTYEQHEFLAAEYQRETGRLSPMKDCPVMANRSDDERLREINQYREWLAERWRAMFERVKAALEKANGPVKKV